jgi:Na+:H+ antiporter, NhaA family
MSTDKQPGCQIDPQRYPLAKTFRKAVTPIEDFIHKETSSGILLMACTIAAIVIANSPLFPLYDTILHTKVTIGGGSFSMTHTVHHWINDGLMVLFFFVVGLEVKREILIGELSDFRQALLPMSAAIGGMMIPALFYYMMNTSGDAARGWGIPMATDIAFALGVIALLGKRIPKPVIPFLLALAIVDDLGAVLIIAVFYTESIHLAALLAAGGCTIVLIILNRSGTRSPLPYTIVGFLLWIAMLKSGVHATLAGVLTAFAIPASSSCDATVFIERMTLLTRDFMDQISMEDETSPELNILKNSQKQLILSAYEDSIHKMESPLQRMEEGLHIWVSFLIVPIFALANAGIPIAFNEIGSILQHPVTLGIMLGLIGGKTIGIFVFSWIITSTGLSKLPESMELKHIGGVSMLAGIGFTMSIFIGSLAFSHQPELLLNAKIGIVLASLIAGVGGYLWLRKTPSPI